MRITFEERLFLIVLGVTLGAALLLISAGQGTEYGQRPWQPGSVLHFVTRLINFDYAYPTPKGVTIKRLAAAAGTAVALIITAVMWCRRHSPVPAGLPGTDLPVGETNVPAPPRRWRTTLSAVDAAQLAMLACVVWSFLSAIWSPWPEVALGESVLLAIGVLWAVSIGRALSHRAAMTGAAILVAMLVVTAVLGLWYFYERNPVQRLKFPIGNPLFLGACLVPGVLVAAHVAVGSVVTAAAQRRWRVLLWVLPAVVALVPTAWALRLTGARGAWAGLAVGVWASVFLRLRRRWRWLAIVVAAGGLYAGYWYAHTKINDLAGGRGATIRLRLYGWQYAWRLFLGHPATGLGQGGYSLVADSLARRDAETDPAAFVGDRLVHAHNEWLESLADLGAVGITCLALGYGVTLWAGRLAIVRSRGALPQWCAVGMMASLAALLAEESTDVGLRLPGLPVVWYSVLGLTWAMMRGEERPCDRAAPFPRPVLWIGTGAAFAVAVILLTWSVYDWEGALAEARVPALMKEKRWAEAAEQAEAATVYRLAADEIPVSIGQKVLCYVDIAAFHLSAVLNSADGRPFRDTEGTPLGNLLRQDVATAESYMLAAHGEAMGLLRRVPTYPYVAGEVGRLLLYWAQVIHEVEAPVNPQEAAGVRNEGRRLLLEEYKRNRLNVEAAVRCVAAWPDRPMDERLEWMCTALRGSSVPTGPPEYQAILTRLMNEPDFTAALDRRLPAARASAAAAGPSEWQDRFAPETFRISAMALSYQSRWADAVRALEPAIRMYQQIRVLQPTMLPITLGEQAWYAFLASPDDPQEARRLVALAIREVPPIGAQEQQLVVPLQRSQILYCLAGGAEEEAAALAERILSTDDRNAVMRQIGLAYAELAGQFVGMPPEVRPKRLPVWLQRAAQLAPDSTTLCLLQAQFAFEAGRDEELVRLLKKAESLGVDPERIEDMLRRALSARPQSRPLADFARERGLMEPTSAPATSQAAGSARPATAPAAE